MKLSAFDQLFNSKVSMGDTFLTYSNGSNSADGDLAGGGDVVGYPGDYTVVGLRQTVSLASNILGNPPVIGDVLTLVSISPPIARFATSSNIAGGVATPVDHGNMGATETIDADDGDWHRGTLDANCTITVQGFTVDEAQVVLVKIAQDATGGWDITWDGDVIFSDDDQPGQAANSVTWFVLWSDEGDSVVYGEKVGGTGSSVDLSDATPLADSGSGSSGTSSEASRADHVHPVATGGEMLISDTASSPVVFTDILQNEAETDFLYSD